MSDLRKGLLLWGLMFAVGFYFVFVVQQLWNWFAVPLLHVGEASYWQMYAFKSLVSLFLANDLGENPVEKSKWSRAFLMLQACVPFELKNEINRQLRDEQEEMWGALGGYMGGAAFSYSLSLGIGFLIHTLS